ncbi:hypothetical protein AgCh_010467 [Apium graveolens]
MSYLWAIARHFNYFGDLLLALSFSLPWAYGISISPYFVNMEREEMKQGVQRSIKMYGQSIVKWFPGEYFPMFINGKARLPLDNTINFELKVI